MSRERRRKNNAARRAAAGVRIPFQIAQEGFAEEGLLRWRYKPIWERSQTVTPDKTWRENTGQALPNCRSMLNDTLHRPFFLSSRSCKHLPLYCMVTGWAFLVFQSTNEICEQTKNGRIVPKRSVDLLAQDDGADLILLAKQQNDACGIMKIFKGI